MNLRKQLLLLAAGLLSAGVLSAQDYSTRVVARGLHRPTGIVAQGGGTLYFTEVPTPGVNGMNGGSNGVLRLDLDSARVTTLHLGEPEPVNLALGKSGELYWTCKSAGVILEQSRDGVTGVFLRGLAKPSGVAVDRDGTVFFTQLPTPGINGMNGGSNGVFASDGALILTLHLGEPEPTDIAVARDGDLYWTCKSAGVILKQDAAGTTTVLLRGLNKPVGIAIDHKDRNLFFTEVPTPGVSGRNGGQNKVWRYDLSSGALLLVNAGDPEPTDVTVARNGRVFWTCTSAGVIVEARLLKRGGKELDSRDDD
jgi:glucose/arabinose dehydrogenase